MTRNPRRLAVLCSHLFAWIVLCAASNTLAASGTVLRQDEATEQTQEAADAEAAKEQEEQEEEEIDERDNPLHLATWGLKDAVRFPNGRIVFLRDYYGPSNYQFSDEDLTALCWANTSHYKYFTRLFHFEADAKAVYAIEARNEGASGHAIYRHQLDGEKADQVAKFREKITSPQYLITDNGTAYIYGRNGLIYRWSLADGLTRYEIPPPEDYRERQAKRRSVWRPLHALKLPNNQVAFYSHVDPRYPKCELRDLLIFDGPKPKRVSLDGKPTGPTVHGAGGSGSSANNSLTFCCSDRFVNVNLETAQLTETAFKRPTTEGVALIPTHQFSSQPGTTIVLWRKPFLSKRNQTAPSFADGYLNRFSKFENGGWTMLGRGKDLLADNANTFDIDSKGNTWISMGHGGVLRIGIDGELTDYGFESGLGFTAPDLIKIDRKDDFLMWAGHHNEPVISFIDTKAIIKSKEQVVGKWDMIISRTPLEWDKRDRFMLFSTAPGQGLIDYQQGGQVSVETPEGLDVTEPITVTRDSNDDLWIIQDSEPDITWYRKDGSWKRFDAIVETVMQKDPDDESKEPIPVTKVVLPSKEVAFQAMLERGANESYFIGRRFNKYRVAYGTNKQIAFRNEGDRVSYFDGKRWSISREGLELPDEHLSQQVFFHEGKTTIYGDAEYSWNLKPEQWKQTWETTEARPWNRIDAVEYPYEGEQYTDIAASHPEGGPFAEDETKWGYRASNIQFSFVRAHDEIAIHHPTGYWNVIKSTGTPLDRDSSFHKIWVDCDNRWFFEYDTSGDLYRYAVYEPETVEFKVVDANLGKIDRPGTKVRPKWTTNPPLEKTKFRYRVGSGYWSAWIDPTQPVQLNGFLGLGVRTLELQLTSESRPLRHHSLRYQFEVTYQLERFLLPLYEQMKSDDYEVRQKAVDGIITAGPSAIPFLKKQMETDNAELKMTLEMLVQLLDRESGDEQDE